MSYVINSIFSAMMGRLSRTRQWGFDQTGMEHARSAKTCTEATNNCRAPTTITLQRIHLKIWIWPSTGFSARSASKFLNPAGSLQGHDHTKTTIHVDAAKAYRRLEYFTTTSYDMKIMKSSVKEKEFQSGRV